MEQSKYARVERERRFLLERFPEGMKATRVRRITDRYIEATTLRLREVKEDDGPSVFKLTQKVVRWNGPQQGFITNIYLTQEELGVFAQLRGRTLNKVRYSVPPFGIDVFEGILQGLVLAEAEFDSEEAAGDLEIPSFVVREVTGDKRFTGGWLVGASREEVERLLDEFGVKQLRPHAPESGA